MKAVTMQALDTAKLALNEGVKVLTDNALDNSGTDLFSMGSG
jgi:hypothetical protein